MLLNPYWSAFFIILISFVVQPCSLPETINLLALLNSSYIQVSFLLEVAQQ
jgi:hypothetical protein